MQCEINVHLVPTNFIDHKLIKLAQPLYERERERESWKLIAFISMEKESHDQELKSIGQEEA